MRDYSQAKHIDLTQNVGMYEEGTVIASIFGNSFGDQEIHYRIFLTKDGISGFETVQVDLNHEGNHVRHNDMVLVAEKIQKKYF